MTPRNTMQGAAVRVIVVNYNGGPYLARALKSLADQTFTNFEAVIVDNASSDDSLEGALPPNDGRFRLLRQPSNLGFATANNIGARGATAEFLALLNSDAFPTPTWLATLVDAARNNPDVAMFGSTQLRADDPSTFDGVGDGYFIGGIYWRAENGAPARKPYPGGEVFSPCAAAALYRRINFEAVGGFDEHFFCFGEDVDLGFRIRLTGGRCLQVADAVVHHVWGASTGRVSTFSTYYISRNQLWTYTKNMPGILFWLFLPMHVALHTAYIIRAIPRGTAKARLRGFFDGIANLGTIWRMRRQIQRARAAKTSEILHAMTLSPCYWLKHRQHLIA